MAPTGTSNAQPCIFLSRHGESEYMLKQLLGGNPPLTSKGQAYAQQLPQLILPLVLSPQAPVSVLTSTLQRTIQTAAHLPFAQQRLSALDEVNAGICEHMSYEQVAQAYPAVAQARAADKLGYRYPEGESYLDLVQRLWPVVHQLEHRSSHVVVVAHQAVLRVLVGLLLRKPLQEMPRMSIPLHTVMQLTPSTAAGPGSSPYDMTLFKAVLPEQQQAPAPTAAAGTTKDVAASAATAAADPSAGIDGFSRSSSCSCCSLALTGEEGAAAASAEIAAAAAGDGHAAWPIEPMHSWESCSTEMQDVHHEAAHAVLAGQ